MPEKQRLTSWLTSGGLLILVTNNHCEQNEVFALLPCFEQFVAQVEKKPFCLQVALRQAGPDNLGQQSGKLTSWILEIHLL